MTVDEKSTWIQWRKWNILGNLKKKATKQRKEKRAQEKSCVTKDEHLAYFSKKTYFVSVRENAVHQKVM